MENFFAIFPHYGKNVSTLWKTFAMSPVGHGLDSGKFTRSIQHATMQGLTPISIACGLNCGLVIFRNLRHSSRVQRT